MSLSMWVVLLGVVGLVAFGMLLEHAGRNFLNKFLQFYTFGQDQKLRNTPNESRSWFCDACRQQGTCLCCGRPLP